MFRALWNWYYRLTIRLQPPDSVVLEAALKETKIKYLQKLDEEEDFDLHQQIASISADHYAKRMDRIEQQLDKIYSRIDGHEEAYKAPAPFPPFDLPD